MSRPSNSLRPSLAIVKGASSPDPPEEKSSVEREPNALKPVRSFFYVTSLALGITTLALMFKALFDVRKRLQALKSIALTLDAGLMCGCSVALACSVIFALMNQVFVGFRTFFNQSGKTSALIIAVNVTLLFAAAIPTTVTFAYASSSSAAAPALLSVGLKAKYSENRLVRDFIKTSWIFILALIICATLDWWSDHRILLFHARQTMAESSSTKNATIESNTSAQTSDGQLEQKIVTKGHDKQVSVSFINPKPNSGDPQDTSSIIEIKCD
ncbi:hypothetical protein CROQUDRAFT_184607 [Cronartium quercuum f. sp. fusiforme G11]|uniref:Uncharacterized protein n=1 Tax=Cronartium quercuum f. sp. fusiforme G11 TaxID=708437 RepID=A0A9P6T8T4_9BASI|nr:hypothetical protein CROQUDRAFT_184607 [Cronartium quercuum f. sp. fusiforme G11]